MGQARADARAGDGAVVAVVGVAHHRRRARHHLLHAGHLRGVILGQALTDAVMGVLAAVVAA